MTASLETLVVAAYVFADSLSIPRSGPVGKISDRELIALAVAQAATGLPSDRQFLGMVGRLLPGWFPHLPDQSQYNRRLRRLVQTGVGDAEIRRSLRHRLAGTNERNRALTELIRVLAWHEISLPSRPDLNSDTRNDPWGRSIAAARARARGLRNVRTMTLDLSAIDQPDASYDVVLCREGLMLAASGTCSTRDPSGVAST